MLYYTIQVYSIIYVVTTSNCLVIYFIYFQSDNIYLIVSLKPNADTFIFTTMIFTCLVLSLCHFVVRSKRQILNKHLRLRQLQTSQQIYQILLVNPTQVVQRNY